MSQEQPRREEQEAIKYGDIFNVHGDLADKPIAPQDAAMMQAAETVVLGQNQKGGPAASMQSAATRNERAGVVGHTDVSDIAGDEGVTVTETDVPGRRIITEAVGGQVIGQVVTPGGLAATAQYAGVDKDDNKITIGDILTDATAKLPADKVATRQDAEGVIAAELRNNPNMSTLPGGVAAAVTAAARLNENINM